MYIEILCRSRNLERALLLPRVRILRGWCQGNCEQRTISCQLLVENRLCASVFIYTRKT